MKTMFLLLSLLTLEPQFVDSRIYYYYYYNQHPNTNVVRYETQYVLVRTQYGSFYQPVQVPIQNIPPLTTTTTTTTPPTPPEISPNTFFTETKALPMQLYSNYICGIFSQPYLNPFRIGKRSSGPTSNLTFHDFQQLLDCFLENEIESTTDNHKSNQSYSMDKRDMDNDSSQELIQRIRSKLVRGISASNLEKFKAALNDILYVEDIDSVVGAIYEDKINLANEAAATVSMFYVSSPASSPASLSYTDKKRLLIDLMLVTNGRAECEECDVDFVNAKEIADALYRGLLPRGMNETQIQEALEGIEFLSKAKLSVTDASNIFKKFVQDFTGGSRDVGKRQASANNTNEHDDSGGETNESPEDDDSGGETNESPEDDDDKHSKSFLSTILGESYRQKRATYFYQPTFDKQIACFMLYNYMVGSPYCGVQIVASHMYKYLQCSTVKSPLQHVRTPSTATAPSPTTTTAPSPTTTTAPSPTTSTAPNPTTTTAPSPTTTTAPSPTTTTTPSLTTTATPSPTTTTTPSPTTTTAPSLITTATPSPTTTATPSPTTTTAPSPTTATTPSPTTTTAPSLTTTTAPRPTTATTPASTMKATSLQNKIATPAQCGVSDIATRSVLVATSKFFVSPRVVGGHMAGTCTTYPWMVRLMVNSGEVCGATILDERHILTAAHCAANKYQMKAMVGEYDTSMFEGTEQVFDINMDTGVSIHPEFNSYAKINDVAVLTLDKPINFDEICAAPICLSPTFVPTPGQSCMIAGWGALSENSLTASTTLQEASISTFHGTDCASRFPNAGTEYFTDPTKQLCAGQPNLGGVDSCEGDSGGPLMCLDPSTSMWVVAGVVSYGEGCARAAQPGVYAQASSYYDWIQQQLKN